MAFHTILLTIDEEGALKALAARANDPNVTSDTQLAALVHTGLKQLVVEFVAKQVDLAKQILADTDTQARNEIYVALQKPTVETRITALLSALSDFKNRLPK